MSSDAESALRLICGACGVESDVEARGWRALLGLEDDGTEVTEVLCPDCADEKFGDA